MALPATATFTGTDNQELTAANANFTSVTGAMAIWHNRVSGNTSNNESCYRWNADTFNNDQYAQIVVTEDLEAANFIGGSVRCQSGSAGYYSYYEDLTNRYFFKMVTGTYTDLVAPKTGVTNNLNDVLRIEAQGNLISAFLNGAADSGFSVTDNSHASGSGGVSGWGSLSGTNNDTLGDTWEAGNLGGVKRMMLLGVG